MSETLAWAAGLFDGEGNFYAKDGRYATAQMNMTEEEPVRRFAAALAPLGKVYGPYENGRGCKQFWRWQCSRRSGVEQVLELLRPHLSEFRVQQAERALAALADL